MSYTSFIHGLLRQGNQVYWDITDVSQEIVSRVENLVRSQGYSFWQRDVDLEHSAYLMKEKKIVIISPKEPHGQAMCTRLIIEAMRETLVTVS